MNYKDLKNNDKDGIHEVLFQMDIIKLEDSNKVEKYYNMLPNDIIKDGIHYGFQDSVIRDKMYIFFNNYYKYIKN